MSSHRGLGWMRTAEVRRVLLACRIGLARGPDGRLRIGGPARPGGPGSVAQLHRKAAACRAELTRRGQATDEDDGTDGPFDWETAMSDTAEASGGVLDAGPDAAEPDFCVVPGCAEFAKRDGLCLRHLVAAQRGDPEAAEALRLHQATRPGTCVPTPPKTPWSFRRDRRPAGAPDEHSPGHAGGERRPDGPGLPGAPAPKPRGNDMATKYGCGACGKTFKNAHGLQVHTARIHGPKALARKKAAAAAKPTEAPASGDGRYRCETCDRTFKSLAGLSGHQKAHRGQATSPAAKPPAMPEAGTLGRDGRKESVALIGELARRFDLPLSVLTMDDHTIVVHKDTCLACQINRDGRLSAVVLHFNVTEVPE